MKKYENPMLQVVGIKNNDIITDSLGMRGDKTVDSASGILAPGQRGMDDWDAGY